MRKIDSLIAFELFDNPLDQTLIDVVATQMRVAVGRLDLHYAFADFKDGNIKSATTKVEYGDGFVLLLVETISQRGCRRLINDAHHFETRNFAGILGSLAL